VSGGPTTGERLATIADRVAAHRARLAAVCEAAGRSPVSITTVVVTKTHPPAVLRAAMAAGLDDIGESRVQEMLAKMERVEGARWHLVGRLQRNKARDVVGTAALVHAVDRASLVDTLARRAEEAGVEQAVLIQVNVGGDPAKAGCSPEETLGLVGRARDTGRLEVQGLMTIPPAPPPDVDPNEHAVEHFDHLRHLRDEVQESYPDVGDLSMGMSDDLEAAVEAGATIVRIGTALLGPREDPPWEPR
jgi:PLP dependent protein